MTNLMAEAETKSVADVLREARKLIEKPENWIKNGYAQDAGHLPVTFHDPKAVCFCSEGALFRAARNLGTTIEAPYRRLAEAVGDGYIPGWNDAANRTHAEVLAAFDAAIARAQEAQ